MSGGRAAGGLRLLGQNAEGMGCGKQGAAGTLVGHSSFVFGVAITADGKRAVSAAWDWTLNVWDVASGSVVHTLKGHSSLSSELR